jgi:hypothetical protein
VTAVNRCLVRCVLALGLFVLLGAGAAPVAPGVAAAPAAPAGVDRPLSDCSRTSVGFIPLNDLGAGSYQGYQGGLYRDGLNTPPAWYGELGLAHAGHVVPRNAGGLPDPNGRIVLLSIGMSNATQEYSTFKAMADADPRKNPRVTIVDGAQGGQDAEAIRDPNAPYWTTVDQRLAAAGATREQVQAIWLKEAIAGVNRAFPADAQWLRDDLRLIVAILESRFPRLQLIYLSSRIYAGYATTTLNPEPYAYQSGFAVKWLIEERLGVNSPGATWLGWGPYPWADGLVPRSDGLIWLCTDFQSDGTHPSTSGRSKVATMLLNFFVSDVTAVPWFVRPSRTAGPIAADR